MGVCVWVWVCKCAWERMGVKEGLLKKHLAAAVFWPTPAATPFPSLEQQLGVFSLGSYLILSQRQMQTNFTNQVVIYGRCRSRRALTQHQKLACLSLNCAKRTEEFHWRPLWMCPVSPLPHPFALLFPFSSWPLEPGEALFKQTVSHSHKAQPEEGPVRNSLSAVQTTRKFG